jgi:two-component system chemotaxis response regulator CheY
MGSMATDLAMSILVVEDFGTMARIVQALLAKIGFKNIDHAGDVPSALARLREKKYGLVLSDWNMEPVSGYAFLKELRADPDLKRTPFIIMTADAKPENVVAAKKAGVDNYLVKPFTAPVLKAKIDAVFTYDPEQLRFS